MAQRFRATLCVHWLGWQTQTQICNLYEMDAKTKKCNKRLIMAALWNRAGHYIIALWFLLLSIYLFSLPNLSRRTLDVYHTSTHGVALVRI